MTLRSRIFSILIILFFNLSAQRPVGGGTPEIRIVGKLIDAATEAVLEFGTVSIFDTRDSSLVGGSMTDAEGMFEVNVRPGAYYAVAEFISYNTKIIQVQFDRDAIRAGNRDINLGSILLTPASIQLEGVEIRAEKSETQFSLDKRIFNVGQDLANRGGSAQDILDNVPSVTVDIEGQVSLRGSTGVRILIDGKPSGLANADNANGLRAIPANLIERVEVITNPSSRYEAEGMAGIINIVLKKDKGSGFNGSFDVNAGFPEQYGAGANVNYRKNKVNWFLNYGLNRNTSPGFGNAFQQSESGAGTLFQEQTSDRNRAGISNNIRFGIDIIPDDKTILTGAFILRKSHNDNINNIIYNDYLNDFPGNPITSTLRTDDEDEDETNLNYSVNYKREFSSSNHTLEFNVQYQDNAEIQSSDFRELATVFNGNPIPDVIQRSNNDESNREWLFQLDFIKPVFKEGKIELGARTSLRNIDNDYLVEQLQDGDWFNLEGLSNDFRYTENVHALYAIIGNKTGKFNYQFGLRAEYSDVITELLQTNEINDRSYANLFPSIFLNYQFNEGNALQVSYSQRIRRPRFWDLNPFFNFSDSRNTFSGNPNLDPEFTDSYELNYLKYFEALTVTGGLFYRHTTDVISRVLVFKPDGTTNRQPENLATGDDYGLEATVAYSGIKWLRLDANANFFRSIVNGKNVNDSFSADTYTWFGRTTARFSFWKGADLQLRFNYRAPRDTPQGRNKSEGSVDIGFSKDILGKNGTVTLGVRDMFNSRIRRDETFGEGFYRQSEFQWRARSLNLAFNYRINQKKQRQARGGGSEGAEGPEF